MMRKARYGLLLLGLALVLGACGEVWEVGMKENRKPRKPRIWELELFADTPVWELAVAVDRQQTGVIERWVKAHPEWLNYQEPQYGATLLLWAVGTEKYRSAEKLLELGADPDIGAPGEDGETPLLVAAGFSWVDRQAKRDPKYVKLLLRYGADPNKTYSEEYDPENKSVIEPGTSPLMRTIGRGIEKTKALVEAGADINYKTKWGTTAAIKALNWGDVFPEYAYYLIVEKKARVTDPYYLGWYAIGDEDPYSRVFYPVDILRDWIFDLGSKEYRMKMAVVEEFARQGVDYWSRPIPEETLELIQKRYPDTWEEYIKKY